jgi:presenilin-like A22 family membrane protease
MLHAIFLGFVFAMIFGHAPIIFPAVLCFDIEYKPSFYFSLVLLHASLVVRVAGELLGSGTARLWGGLFNILAVILYLIMVFPLGKIFKLNKR